MSRDAVLALLRDVTEIPAPPFGEARRGEWVRQRLAAAGLAAWRDQAGNVLAELPGGEGPRVALAAHLDTVFPADTDVRVRIAGGRWRAPGIGDNSASVALLLDLATELGGAPRTGARPRLLVAFTVGEEGEGDLRGARHAVRQHGHALDAFVALDGQLGTVVDAAVGSRRYRLTFVGPGGHSWGDYPSPSAVHALGDAVHALHRLPLPEAPRSSVNVGQVGGGTGINAIAEEAWAKVDVRSLDAGVLGDLAQAAERRARRAARRHGVQLHVEAIGERPAGRSDDGWLRSAACAALDEARITPHVAASSTDAGAAVAAGLPALCLGLYRGGDAHRRSEWVDPESLAVGARLLRDFLARLAASPKPHV